MYKIAISDLDGTLLGPDHRISPNTKESIKRWIDNNRKFVIATGRHYIEAKKLQASIGSPIYLITCNGARVHNKQGEIIHRQNLGSDIAQWICDNQFDDGVQINLFTDQNWYANHCIPDLDAMGLDAGFDCVATDLSALDKSDTIKIFFWAEPELLQPIYELLNNRYGHRINLTFSLDKCLEVMHANTNKGEAVKVVLKDKGLQIEDAIAFGDGMNDVEMLSLVGKAVLMANAQQALRQALPVAEYTLSSKEDGVAIFLNNLLAK
ncbi:Cof-type HAD-IIB family hydrolase [Psychromonas antarctica]|jgi:Cof subfamily protein (haloacid dehalogenase superfamily)|uniref:Cof-type HAD-IIB family hydrolase n=1 Tax=Psychromonas antarctica TaxID=67573 RepID=UPI001EE7BD5C|nr:Cof-type HAD-IIB family hydrolase [Psychromonas antarctica]MCG6201461.1 Cof-type HAD-IIB family hydrolase [Psychromonas antarctica]